jgi:hypothetical protein
MKVIRILSIGLLLISSQIQARQITITNNNRVSVTLIIKFCATTNVRQRCQDINKEIEKNETITINSPHDYMMSCEIQRFGDGGSMFNLPPKVLYNETDAKNFNHITIDIVKQGSRSVGRITAEKK